MNCIEEIIQTINSTDLKALPKDMLSKLESETYIYTYCQHSQNTKPKTFCVETKDYYNTVLTMEFNDLNFEVYTKNISFKIDGLHNIPKVLNSEEELFQLNVLYHEDLIYAIRIYHEITKQY